MWLPGVTFHLDDTDRVFGGTTRDAGSGRVITDVTVSEVAEPGRLHPVLSLVGSPRVLRRIAEELTAAADAACRREDELSDTPLFEGAQRS